MACAAQVSLFRRNHARSVDIHHICVLNDHLSRLQGLRVQRGAASYFGAAGIPGISRLTSSGNFSAVSGEYS